MPNSIKLSFTPKNDLILRLDELTSGETDFDSTAFDEILSLSAKITDILTGVRDRSNDGIWFHVASNQLINTQQVTLKELGLFEGDTEKSFLQNSEVRFGVDNQDEITTSSGSAIEGHPRDQQAKFTVNHSQLSNIIVIKNY